MSMVMQSTGCGSGSTTNTKMPVRLELGGDERVGDLPGEHLAQRVLGTAPCSTRMVPDGPRPHLLLGERGQSCSSLTSDRLSSWLPMTVSVATRVESRVSAMRPWVKWTSMSRSGHSMCRVPERRILPSICRISTTPNVSSVPCILPRSL